MKILIVDDARWQRQNLTRMLSAAGHEVIQATNGKEALERREERAPVVIASADIQRTSRERCTALGAAAFLAKPYQPTDILPLLDSVLAR